MPNDLKQQKELMYRMSCHGGEHKQLVEQDSFAIFCSNELQKAGENTQGRMQRGQICADFLMWLLDGLSSGARCCVISS